MTTLRPRPLLATAIAATAALGLAGCIQSEDRTTLLPDGSGTMSQTITMDLAKLKELEDLGKMMSGAAPGAPGAPGAQGADGGLGLDRIVDEILSEKSLREQFKDTPGVEVKRLTTETKDGKRVLNLDVAFADYASLGRAGFQTTAVDLKKNDDGTWTLSFEGIKDLLAAVGAGGGGEGAQGLPPGMDMNALAGLLEPYFGSMTVERRIQVPGKVVATNGTASEDGTSAVWKLTWKDVVAAMAPKDGASKEAPSPGQMTVTFKGDGLALKPFSYRPDPAAMHKKAMNAMKGGPAGAAKPAEAPSPKPEPAPATTPGSGK